MIQLNYHHLYYFKVIATEGSISKAAQKLMLGQPTLSMQLKQFEDFLGRPLFERRNRSLVLTEIGVVVLAYANEIFKIGQELLDSVNDRPTNRNYRLQIGSLDSVPKALLKSLLRKALAAEDCQVAVIEGENPHLIEDLVNHRLDLILSSSAMPHLSTNHSQASLQAKLILSQDLKLYASKSYLEKANLKLNSFNQFSYILPPKGTPVRHQIEEWFTKNQIKAQIVTESQDTNLLYELACDGMGAAALSEQMVVNSKGAEWLVELSPLSGVKEEFWLLACERQIPNPMAEKLMREYEFAQDTKMSY